MAGAAIEVSLELWETPLESRPWGWKNLRQISLSCFPSQKQLPFIPGSALPVLLVTGPGHFPKQLCWKASPQPECVSLSLTHQL